MSDSADRWKIDGRSRAMTIYSQHMFDKNVNEIMDSMEKIMDRFIYAMATTIYHILLHLLKENTNERN